MPDDLANQKSPNRLASQAEERSELQEFATTMHKRRRVFPRAALVGLGAGLVAALFRAALAAGDNLRNALIDWSHSLPVLGWIFPILFSVTGALVSVGLVSRFAPETGGSGIPHLEAVLRRLRTLQWTRVLPIKFLAGASAIGGGLPLGREGPTVQMGGAVGGAISSWLRVPAEERRTLIAAGAGAGLAAAFNAPLAGVMFVVEEIRRDFHPIVFGAAFLAAALADIVVRLILGNTPDFPIPTYATPPILSLPAFIILGVCAGILGVLFNRTLLGTLALFGRARSPWAFGMAAVVGAAVGLTGWFSPILVGGGHTLASAALAGNVVLSAIPLFFVMRFFLTTSSYGSGAAGGIFAPLLALGALLGLGVGQIAHNISPTMVPEPAVFAVVGMAAYFAAIVRAPITGIVLIVEMTGNYQQILPLLVSCFCAYAVAELLKDLPIYEALLERDLMQGGSQTSLKEPMVIDFEIERDAPFVGRQVQFLGLPPGCVLIRCVEAGHEFVPTAATRLDAHMRITAVIAPQAVKGLEILQRGCRAAGSREAQPHEM